jgi:hypothetical protein
MSGTVSHSIKIQVGDKPDTINDGHGVINLPLDESPHGVATRLAKIAQAMLAIRLSTGAKKRYVRIVKVDNTPCSIPVADSSNTPKSELINSVSQLVAPRGWRPK